jgi:hypothetical protein
MTDDPAGESAGSDFDRLPPDVAEAARGARRVIVPTDDADEPARARARQAAVRVAAAAGAELILLDRSDATWGDTPHTELHDRDALAAAGKDTLAGQVDAAAEAGVTATVWAHSLPAPEALGDSVRDLAVDLVVVADDFDKPGLLDRLRTKSVVERAFDAVGDTPVVVVAEDGSLSVARSGGR